LADEQNGFRKRRGTLDHLSTRTSLIETWNKCKQSTYVAFIDLQKAYDSVDRDKLWCKLRDVGVQGKTYRAIMSMYKHVVCV
jgi:hypothetical protein